MGHILFRKCQSTSQTNKEFSWCLVKIKPQFRTIDRMHIARLLTVSHSIPLGGRGSTSRGVFIQGWSASRGVYIQRVCIQGSWADPPGCRPPGHVTGDACWETNPSPSRGQTNICENITLPQTSFVRGNY